MISMGLRIYCSMPTDALPAGVQTLTICSVIGAWAVMKDMTTKMTKMYMDFVIAEKLVTEYYVLE
jgi:hypothetical protein